MVRGQAHGDEQRTVGPGAVARGHQVVGALAGQLVGAVGLPPDAAVRRVVAEDALRYDRGPAGPDERGEPPPGVGEILGVLRGNDGFAEKKADSFDQAVIKAVEALKDSLQTEKTSSSNRPVNPPYGGTG